MKVPRRLILAAFAFTVKTICQKMELILTKLDSCDHAFEEDIRTSDTFCSSLFIYCLKVGNW